MLHKGVHTSNTRCLGRLVLPRRESRLVLEVFAEDRLRGTVGEASTSGAYHYVGVVEENKSAALSFATAGTIRQIMVDEGQRVAQGQLLATLDRSSAQSTFDASAASLHQAEDAYTRMKQLYDKKSLPEMQMVEVETRLQQARSMYELSKKNLGDCALHAPYSRPAMAADSCGKWWATPSRGVPSLRAHGRETRSS